MLMTIACLNGGGADLLGRDLFYDGVPRIWRNSWGWEH